MVGQLIATITVTGVTVLERTLNAPHTKEEEENVGIVKESVPPPPVKEDEILSAAINDIRYPVKSKFEDEEGNVKMQVKFQLEFDNGYRAPVYMAYYKSPGDRSVMGKLILSLQELNNVVYDSVDQAFQDLKTRGRLFVRCNGFREWNEQLYPKWKVVPTRLPPRQRQISFQEETKPVAASPPAKSQELEISPETLQVIRRSKDIISMGIPLNQSDWDTTLPAKVRVELMKCGLVEEKDGLYFFTPATKSFF